MVILRLNTRLILNISDVLRDLVSFVQFKKREKTFIEECYFK